LFAELIRDVRYQIRTGGFLTRVIVLCVLVFVLVNLVKSYFIISSRGIDNGDFHDVLRYAGLSADPYFVLTHPWVLITHAFIHEGLFHLLWNMMALYWFGRIVEDLIGRRHLMLVFFQGIVAGAIFYIGFAQWVPWMSGGSMALGASAAVMAMLLCAATLAPDYGIRLILIGNVPIKYLAVALLLLDLLFAGQNSNTGGRIAHLGGALWGYLYVILIRSGVSLDPMNWLKGISFLKQKKKNPPIRKIRRIQTPPKKVSVSPEERMDHLLDKIRLHGIDSLTAEEREELDHISKHKT
jgi:membrane associated rhomboid family serine protease